MPAAFAIGSAGVVDKCGSGRAGGRGDERNFWRPWLWHRSPGCPGCPSRHCLLGPLTGAELNTRRQDVEALRPRGMDAGLPRISAPAPLQQVIDSGGSRTRTSYEYAETQTLASSREQHLSDRASPLPGSLSWSAEEDNPQDSGSIHRSRLGIWRNRVVGQRAQATDEHAGRPCGLLSVVCMHARLQRPTPGIEEWIGSIAQRHGLVMLPEGSLGPACRGAEPRNRPASRGAPVEQFCQQTALSGTVLRAYRCAVSHRMLTSRTVPLLCPSNNSPSNDAGIEGRPCELTRPEAQPSPRFRLLPADGREYMRPMARAALAHRAAGPGYSDRIDSNTTADSGG